MATRRARIIITMNEDTLNQLKVQADKMGVSANAYVNFVVGQHLTSQHQIMDKMEEVITNLVKKELKE